MIDTLMPIVGVWAEVGLVASAAGVVVLGVIAGLDAWWTRTRDLDCADGQRHSRKG